MASEIPDEMKRKIVEMRHGEGNDYLQTETAEILGVGNGTVSKYADRYEDGELAVDVDLEDPFDPKGDEGVEEEAAEPADSPEPADDSGDSGDSGEFTSSQPVFETGGGGEEVGEPNFSEMTPKDFIQWFFTLHGHGVRKEFTKFVADNAMATGGPPNKQKLITYLLDGSSGINNRKTVELIAETYEKAAERYFDAQNEEDLDRLAGEWHNMGTGGTRESEHPPRDPRDRGTRQEEQRHPPRGSERTPRDNPPRDSPSRDNPPRSDGRGRGDRRPESGSDPVNEAVMELKETQEELARTVNQILQGNTNNQQESLRSQVEEVKEISDTLEDIRGGGGRQQQTNSDIDSLRDEIRSIRQELNGGVEVSGDDGFGGIAKLASDEDIGAEELGVIADAMGVTDPEVKKAEYDYKKETEKMANRKELVDAIFDNIGEVGEDVISAAIQNATGGGSGESAPQGGGQQARTPQEEPGSEGSLEPVDEPGCPYILDEGGTCGKPPADGSQLCPEHDRELDEEYGGDE